MPITSTCGFDISSDTCCSPISASPLETSTLTRPFGPPAASLTFGVTSAAMPSLSNTPMTWAAVTPPPAGAVWAMDFAASSARLSASGDDTSGVGAPERRREFIDRRLHGGGDHGVDLGGMGRARGHDQRSRGRDRACAHDTSSYHAGSSPFAL